MERVLEKLGPWHIPVFLLALLGSLPYGLFVLSLSFMAPKVNYWCKSPKGINYSEWMQMNAGVDLRCSVRVAVPQSNALHSNISQVESENCHEWEYDHSVHTKTLIEEWDAVCDHDWMLATAQSCLMFGVLVGCFVFSHISDWYGRKTALSLSLGICIIIGFGISFTNNYWLFCVLRFLMAFGHGGKRASSVLTTESVSAHHRAIVTVGQDVGWCLGLLLTPLITYYVRDWVWIQRAIIMPELAFVLLLCFVDESPKWLLSAGHEAKARRLLKKIIRVNKLYEEEIDIDQIVRDTTVALMKENRSQKSTLIDLLNEWTVLRLTISCWGQYAVIILLYYHMLYFIVDTGSDPYTGVFYMGLLELPIATLSCWVVNNFRRRPVYFWSYLLSVFSVVALLFPADDNVTVCMVLANLGKMSSMLLYNCLLVHISECFPTKVRSLALGTSAMSSRIGAMAAPFLKQIGLITASWVPICLTIGMCAVAMCLSFILPETFGEKLPDTFNETKQTIRKTSESSKSSPLIP